MNFKPTKKDWRNICLILAPFWFVFTFVIWSAIIPTIGGSPSTKDYILLIFGGLVPFFVLLILGVILSVNNEN